jgi:hypothetical protein
MIVALSAGTLMLGSCHRKLQTTRTLPPRPERVTVRVDPRVELLSILAHLAGSREYNNAYPSPYLDAVNAHFAPFKDHRAVAMTRELHDKFSISYNAPLTLAIDLDDSFQPIDALSPLPEGIDERWKGSPVAEYLAEVRDFAKATDFAGFLASQRKYVDGVESSFRTFLTDKPILPWFDQVFGPNKQASYLVAPGLLTGRMNYGVHVTHPDGTVLIAEIMNLEGVDASGVPHLGEMTHALLAHELAHSYVNPIIEGHLAELQAAIQPAFDRVHDAMAKQAYPTLANVADESVVRAITVLYLRDAAGPDAAARSLDEQHQLSFFWTDDLADEIDARRKQGAGAIDAAGLVAATNAAFTKWSADHPQGAGTQPTP